VIAYRHGFVAALAVMAQVRKQVLALLHAADLLVGENIADLTSWRFNSPEYV
jgi:hypothetical protein